MIVREGMIAAIQPGDAAIPLGAIRIDARGKYLMPGLIDCYSHVDGETHLLPYVANGITTVKDSPAPIEHLGLRDRVARGELIGPRILCFSPDLDGEPEYPEVEAVTTPEQANVSSPRWRASGTTGSWSTRCWRRTRTSPCSTPPPSSNCR